MRSPDAPNCAVSEPVLVGDIPEDGIVSRLSEIEAQRTTGVLRFTSGDITGDVALVFGQISSDQKDRDDGEDVIDLLLGLREGRFELLQLLPPLPVSRGDKTTKEGSLDVHVPADLMNYCERAGLTGVLCFEYGKKRVEIVYDRGSLGAIRLDGLEDLNDVFGWEEGSFSVQTHAAVPDVESMPAPPSVVSKDAPAEPDSTGKQFLRVVEVTLAEIVREREERRPATRTSPPLPAMPLAKKHPTLRPPPTGTPRKKRKDQTVRVIYLGGRASAPVDAAAKSTVHVKRGDSTGEVPLADAVPERRPPEPEEESAKVSENEGAAMHANPADASSDTENSGLPTPVWVLITMMVVIGALVILAQLPPMD